MSQGHNRHLLKNKVNVGQLVLFPLIALEGHKTMLKARIFRSGKNFFFPSRTDKLCLSMIVSILDHFMRSSALLYKILNTVFAHLLSAGTCWNYLKGLLNFGFTFEGNIGFLFCLKFCHGTIQGTPTKNFNQIY